MRFLDSKFTHYVLAAGALPRTPLGELKRSPGLHSLLEGPLCGRRRGRERREGGKGQKKEREKGRGREGKGEDREGREEIGGRVLLPTFRPCVLHIVNASRHCGLFIYSAFL